MVIYNLDDKSHEISIQLHTSVYGSIRTDVCSICCDHVMCRITQSQGWLWTVSWLVLAVWLWGKFPGHDKGWLWNVTQFGWHCENEIQAVFPQDALSGF